jgi:hypothetical protein
MKQKRNQGSGIFNLDSISLHRGYACFLHSNSPRRYPSAAQAEGATKGIENQLITTVILSKAKNPVFVGRQ